jgi:hypothetical protein
MRIVSKAKFFQITIVSIFYCISAPSLPRNSPLKNMDQYGFPHGAFALVQGSMAITLPPDQIGYPTMSRFIPAKPGRRQMFRYHNGCLVSADAVDFALTISDDDMSIVMSPCNPENNARQKWDHLGHGVLLNSTFHRYLTTSEQGGGHGAGVIAMQVIGGSAPSNNQQFTVYPVESHTDVLATVGAYPPKVPIQLAVGQMPTMTTVNWGSKFEHQSQPCTAPVAQPHLFPFDDYMMKPETSYWPGSVHNGVPNNSVYTPSQGSSGSNVLAEMPPIVTVNWGEKFDYLSQPCLAPSDVQENLWAFDSWQLEPNTSFWQKPRGF